MSRTRIFRISFFDQGQVYELHSESVREGEFYGFVEIERQVFGENSSRGRGRLPEILTISGYPERDRQPGGP